MNPTLERTRHCFLAGERSIPGRCLSMLLAATVLALTVSVSANAAPARIKRPGAPTAVTATAIDGGASVSWTTPGSDGGSPITGYMVVASPSGQSCATTSATTCTVAGLTDGRLYSIRVRASNASGEGPAARVQLRLPLPTVSLVNNFLYSGGPVGLTLSQTRSRIVRVDFTISDGPNLTLYWGEWIGAAKSFSPSSGTVTFAPGQTTATITFTVSPPTVSGCSPFFVPSACHPSATVTLTNPTNAILGSTPSTNLFYDS